MLDYLKTVRTTEVKIDKHDIIQKSASLDYSTIIKAVTGATLFFSAAKSAIPLLSILKEDSEYYKVSESEQKDDEFVTYLIEHCDITLLKTSLEPIANKVPGGSIILQLIGIIEDIGGKGNKQ